MQSVHCRDEGKFSMFDIMLCNTDLAGAIPHGASTPSNLEI